MCCSNASVTSLSSYSTLRSLPFPCLSKLGMYLGGGEITINTCEFDTNYASEAGALSAGGSTLGLFASQSRMYITSTTFLSNTASNRYAPAAIRWESFEDSLITNCTFRDDRRSGMANTLGWTTLQIEKPLKWHCQLGTWMAPTGSWASPMDFTGCLSKCGQGTIGHLHNLTSGLDCAPCPVGHYCDVEGLSAGIPCRAGTHMPGIGARESTNCLPCGPGRFNHLTAQVQCHPCPAGTFSEEDDSAACSSCPAGGFCPDAGASSRLVFQACPPGSWSSALGTSTNATCQLCPRGTFSSIPGAPSNATCEPCPANHYQPALGAHILSMCLPCPLNSGAAAGSIHRHACLCDSEFFDANETRGGVQCTHCPLEGTQCNSSGVTLEKLWLMPGYWRTFANSTIVHRCPTSIACAGGTNFSAQCEVGYRGPLCATCSPDYRSAAGGTCNACKTFTGSDFLPLVIVLLVLTPLILSCVVGMWLRRRRKHRPTGGAGVPEAQRRGYREPAKTRGQRIVSQLLVKVKIIIANQQVLQGIGSVFKIQWPQAFNDLLSYFKVIDFDFLNLIPLGCLLQTNYLTNLIIRTLLPAGLVVTLVLAGRRALRHGREALGYGLTNGGVLLVFICYPSTTRTVFSFFQTHEFDSGYGTYLMADYSIDCDSASYRAHYPFAIAMVFLWPLG